MTSPMWIYVPGSNRSPDCHSPAFISSPLGRREPDSDATWILDYLWQRKSWDYFSLILLLCTEKLIKFCFKELVLAYDQIWIDDLWMFIYFKILHNTVYIFNAKLITLGEWFQSVLKYTFFLFIRLQEITSPGASNHQGSEGDALSSYGTVAFPLQSIC